MIFKSDSALQTRNFGKKLAKSFLIGDVVCLRGDLGAGKTTLIQGIAKGLGIKRKINSPTFIIARQYPGLWHIDFYRFNSIEEAKNIGIEEILEDNNSIVLMEWPEKIEELLPKKRWEIKIETVPQGGRKISYEALS